jgi:hypothetical protein
MRITVEDCLKLDAFSGSTVVSCKRKSDRRVRTISVLDEENLEMGIERNGVKEQMVLTHFWHYKDDIDAQCRVVTGFGKKSIAALVIFLNSEGVRGVDSRVIKAAEDSGLLIIVIPDDSRTTYASLMEQVMDKILYGHNYSDNILNNTIYHLLNFEKHSNFQSALKEAAINNDYQVVLMTTEFNPILTVETRHKETIDSAITQAKKHDVVHSSMFTQVNIGDVITYWGTIDINGEKHLLMIVDNEDNYSATEIKKLAEIIELAMGMWKYTPERDSRAEFIKSAIRGDLTFCYTLIDEAGLKNKQFISVFYATGINNADSQDILDRYREEHGFGILPLVEGNEFYGMVYADKSDEKGMALKKACLAMYDDLKEGRKDVRIFHSTGIEDLDNAIEGFKMINETWNYVETVFPYKRVFTKYEMSMVCNCINIEMQNSSMKKMYLDLLEPFEVEVSQNKGKLLLETLETFVLDAGMNSNKTSEFMNIHNNTVQYRLKRINEILGAEMTGNRIIPGLTMALALRRMEDH